METPIPVWAPSSVRFYILANYTKTITVKRKSSTEHFSEIGVGESNGDVISGLGRHLAAHF
jgi:hypothetical protein